MNRTQMIKQAYVRGLAARGILRASMLQKRAGGGLGDYAISGGIGAAGGSAIGAIIGALVRYARKKKNVLGGAGIGAGVGGLTGLLGGLGYQYLKKDPVLSPFGQDYVNTFLPDTADVDLKALINSSDPAALEAARNSYNFQTDLNRKSDPANIPVDDTAKAGLPYGLL